MKNLNEPQVNKLFSIIIDASQYNYTGYPISSDHDIRNKVKMIIAGNDEYLKELLDKLENEFSRVEDYVAACAAGADYQVKVMEIKNEAYEKFLSELKEPLVLYRYNLDFDSDDRDGCYEGTDIADVEGITKKEIKILSILEDTDDGVTLIINESKTSASDEDDEDED